MLSSQLRRKNRPRSFWQCFRNQKPPVNDATIDILKPILFTSENDDRKYSPKLLLCALLNIDYHYKARQVKGKLHSAAMVVKRCWLSNADPPFKIFWPFYLPPNVFIAANCTGLSFHEIFANNIFENSFSGHRRIQVQLRWKMKSTTIFPNSSVPSLSPRS